MGIFDRFFKGTAKYHRQRPDIIFGRYSDSYKPEAKYDAWDQALELFEQSHYLPAYQQLLEYLRDDEAENVKWWQDQRELRFDLLQGSKKLTGCADPRKVRAEARIAKATALDTGVMRRLLEKNYDLQYSHFALDPDQVLSIRFDTYTLDGSPYKLYYALKELAINADKQDDLLIDEFSEMEPVEISHLRALPDHLKVVKYDFLHQQIRAAIDYFRKGSLEARQYSGGIAYFLLNLCYKLDYLIKPEGSMMETLERINRRYFASDGQANTHTRNERLVAELEALIQRPRSDFYKEMYHGISTFGITNPVNHDRLIDFIEGELGNMDWYLENQHYEIAQAVPGYIVGYCLFHYALPKPDRDLFHLYYEITEAEYFRALGFSPWYYRAGSQQFNRKAIKAAVRAIAEENRRYYPKLQPEVGQLNYTSLPDFARSYLRMIQALDLTKSFV